MAVAATVNAQSAQQLARELARAPELETLHLAFPERLGTAAIKTLFEVPALQRLHEIEIGGGAPPTVWDRFFASPNVRGVRRLAIGGEHAAKFSRAGWPALEELTVGVDGSATDRKALTRILAANLPRLGTLVLVSCGLGPAGIDVVVRSPVYPRLRALDVRELESAIGDAGIAALARRKTTLARLRFSLLSVTAKGLAALAKLAARIEHVELFGCPLDDDSLRRLAKVPHVRTLGFYGTPSASALTTVLSAMRGLEQLVLGMARDAGPAHCEAVAACDLPRLRVLRITEAKLGAAGGRALAQLASLEKLDLGSSDLGDDGAAALPRLGRLRDLELQFCKIGDRGGAAIAAWPANAALETINLNGNHILDPATKTALLKRFASVHPIAVIGGQHPIRAAEPEPAEPAEPPPKQRPHSRLPPRRRDWRAGLRELVGRNHFAAWDGYVDAKLIAKCEALVDRCVEQLLALGKDADAKAQRAVLKRYIVGFNKLADDIYTLEAENIVETFEAVARYTKLANEEDLADEWREF